MIISCMLFGILRNIPYAQAFARYIQCEEATSTYQKSANLIWYEIYDIVKQNCTEVFEDIEGRIHCN